MKIIGNTTEAAQSRTFNINNFDQGVPEFAGNNLPMHSTFQIIGGVLGASEYVRLEYADKGVWRTANIGGNDGKILDSDNSIATIYGRLSNVRLNKSVTSTAIGVEVI